MTAGWPEPLATRLGRAFATAVRGVLHVSESDFPYRAFSAAWSAEVPITPDTLAVRLGFPPQPDGRTGDIEDWFRYVTTPQGDDSDERLRVAVYGALEAMLRATLTDLTMLYIPQKRQQARVRTFIVGRAGDQNLAGLHTISIET